jgi:PTH1 family peptidyl-tRNA hydrolase
MGQRIDLIAGLGNPDPQYLATRHNAGFWFVDALARQCGAQFSSNKKLFGDVAEVELAGQRIKLLKPMTYMNDSGRSLAAASHYFKIAPEHILVVYDELDLPPGRVKLKFDGGHAGHNGMRSAIEHLGPKFWRVRLGVGHPGQGSRGTVVNHVLRRASAKEEEMIMEGLNEALEALVVLLQDGPERAQNALHTRKSPAADDETGN